ncbi:MAG: T9SS type A sorting domain-containing protein [Chlorobi bacterium]|nr:T9SS type A sorting domain-containing protein [Chlorobiota bacterium]
MKIFLISLIFLTYSFVDATTYTVAETGGDFTSISEALTAAQAGDTIMVRAKSVPYNEVVEFRSSGNETDGYITLMAYPGEHPVIDGSGLENNTDWPLGLVKIINKNYIRVEGFEIRNLIASNSGQFPGGIWIRGTSHHIEIKNNIVHHIEQNGNNAGAHGIAVYGTSGSSSIHDLLIDGNEVYSCKLGWSESLVLNGNVENFVVSNNVIHDNNNIAYDFIGFEGECPVPELDQARNGIVADNIAYNIDSRGNPAYGDEASADGFYVDGGKDILFERNTAYNCNIGFEVASEHGGKITSGIVVRNNLIRENIVLGLSIGGYDSDRGEARDCKIINNTFYKNNSENFNWGAEILLQYYCGNNVFKNNIVFSKSNTPLVENTTRTGENNVFDFNLYFTEGNAVWRWDNDAYSDFASFQTGSGEDAEGLFADPKLADPSNDNPALQSGSPAIDAGMNMSADIVGEFDFFGSERIQNGTIDVGAAEFDFANSIEDGEGSVLPEDFRMLPAYPNPFGKSIETGNVATNIRFIINSGKEKTLKLIIYDTTGRIIENISLKSIRSGMNIYRWNAANLSSGNYFAVLTDGRYSEAVKILLLK